MLCIWVNVGPICTRLVIFHTEATNLTYYNFISYSAISTNVSSIIPYEEYFRA